MELTGILNYKRMVPKLQRISYILLAVVALACKAEYPSHPNEGADSAGLPVEFPPYQPADPRVFDILHTRLDLEFDWEKRWVVGEATLRLKPHFYPQDILILNAKSFEIIGCDRITSGTTEPISFQYDGEFIYLDLEKQYTRDDTLDIKIKYIAKPYERTASGGTAVTSDRGLFFINHLDTDSLKPRQIWTQGETGFNSCWFPTIDSPNERFTQEIVLTVDSSLTTLSNGALQSTIFLDGGKKRDHWKLSKPHAPYLAMIAVGEFKKVDDPESVTPMAYFVEPEYEQYAKDIFGSTPEMLDYFAELLDYPFPWEKYDQIVVRDYVSGAMENTTASVFMEDLQVDSRTLLDDHWDGIIAHELFHQWFGNLVTCESWSHLALNEGFANYAEYLWLDFKYGRDEANHGLWMEKESYMAEVASGKVEPIINYFYNNPDDLFDSHRYSKAGLVLHMLRNYVGDDAFFQSLRLYVKRNAFQSVEIDDLRKAFEEVTGEDLQWFFEQWFESPGHPVLDVYHTIEGDSLYIGISQLQISDTIGMFVLPLEIEITYGDAVETHEVLMDAPEVELSFKIDRVPLLVEIDPKRTLVAEIYHPKTKKELVREFDEGRVFALRREALETIFTEGDSLSVGEIALLGLKDASPRIRELTLDNLSGRGHVKTMDIQSSVKNLTFDSSALVRAAAYSLYAQTEASDTDQTLMLALKDSSYSVVGSGLDALLPDYIEAPYWLDEFLAVRHLNVAAPIAGFFNQVSDPTRLEWYQSNLLAFHGMDRWMFLQYYIEYIVLTTQHEKTEVINVLKYIASSDHQFFNRIAAFQALTLIVSETPANRQLLTDIAEKEEDSRAKSIMTSLLTGSDE